MAATYSSLVGLSVGGKYEIRRVLGAGGMGVVCEAVHLDLGKRVAVKLIDKTMKESELIVARFRREARAAGQIDSEHIVDVFDVGADARVGLYMVMELLHGEDLQTRLERERRLDVKTCVMIAHQVARALDKAHAAGVVHRDLKPANVYLTKRDSGQMLVKLLDFGVSKLLADDGGARITGSGAPIGTPLYMSPEQAEGRDDTDGRADIWSLGAVLYEALAGAPPFPDRGSYHGTIVGILTSRPKLLRDAAPWVPAPLASAVDAMLVHDRSARIRDAKAVTARLLEAFPGVLPDDTGQHTAVIVQSAAVDATGDTEWFSAKAMPPGARGSSPERSSRPDAEDSSRTVPDVTSSGDADASGGHATKTAAATPVTGPKWSGDAASSASGVAMPGTPPILEPVPPSELVPDTMRDTELATRAERRRKITLGALVAGVLAVALGGYYAGRRANEPAAPVAASIQAPLLAPSASAPAPSASAAASASPAPPATSASAAAPSPSASVEIPTTTPSALPAARDPAAPR